MTNFIPLFPLELVPFPGEKLNLHIFEPRYKQLIGDCVAQGKPFGIIAVINNKLMEYGTLMQVAEVKKLYEDGRMDIATRATEVFRVLELVKDLPDKLYSGAIVTYPQNEIVVNMPALQPVLRQIQELLLMLQSPKAFPKPDNELCSYDVASMTGLSMEEAYDLLQLLREDQRIEYLRRHMQKVLPVVKEMELLKSKIKLNGHFRELKSLGFEEE
ncbi:LON peptidase substrate-binding domain-containing protein [Phnomibacter ginsenosidimutans]|jgi:Lon protease-like protein|uniref:Peptidase S16 n=1 Tax=Phnomibacter ginsenosidimutans TaxID=2676868 RepID=A0A6I6GMK1_9BACT|nr:LON peptidase substrate-binding domain-containing protein [Phnomibacter ginsenosidimutans]QGW29745.1 peptidase S16 [Phnomibacter ginsenosidimutans]